MFGAWFTLNGNGEMTGTTWLQESGILEGPIAITNTHSVGVVRDAILQWQVSRPGLQPWGLPVVAETYDGAINDINGFHVKPEHVMAALDAATTGPVARERRRRHGMPFVQGRDGTASRTRRAAASTRGVLVRALRPRRERRSPVPVGEEISISRLLASKDLRSAQTCAGDAPVRATATRRRWLDLIFVPPRAPPQTAQAHRTRASSASPQGERCRNARRHLSPSRANPRVYGDTGIARLEMIPNARINPLFYATVQATEEAIVNALLAAETMTGADDYRIYALPRDRLMAAMRKYGRR